jgi:ferredoxin
MIKIERREIEALFEVLKNNGYTLIGPILRDGAIIYDKIETSEDLPIGWTDQQDAGKYRIEKSEEDSLFNFTCGPQSWKKFLYPPVQKLFSVNINKEDKKLLFTPNDADSVKYAFIGVRACELNAIKIQDKIFTQGEFKNPSYLKRRESLFIVAVNCTSAKGTCFCDSMNTGPKVKDEYDISLTEVIENSNHYFVSESGSEYGDKILNEIRTTKATDEEILIAEKRISNAVNQMGRKLDTNKIDELLYSNLEHPRWDDVATRCLSCANCTMVCPTCFCSTVEDVTDLSGTMAERIQKWDSCFTSEFSYIHGGSIRNSTKSRYRQWLTHKFASWYKQFDSSGCVGCGRCITWCPVGIDVTVEIQAIHEEKNNQPVLREENT